MDYMVHPEYFNHPGLWEGYDIALGFKDEPTKKNMNRKSTRDTKPHFWGKAKRDPAYWKGKHIKISGYPVKYKGMVNDGFQYVMDGTIFEQAEHYKTKAMTFTYKDLDTSGGQSGSPVFWDCSKDGGEDKYTVIAIHIGYSH